MGEAKINIKAVKNGREMDDFVKIAHAVYVGCPYYVPDLDRDIKNAFDPSKNSSLEYCTAQPFVAYDQKGCPIGRIAAIINHHANKKWGEKAVRFSHLEYIDDINVLKALLDAASEWGAAQGMKRIHGPLGFTDFDKEGMLVEDFGQMGSVISIYNHEYYPRHIEALGFEKEADWLSIRFELPDAIPERYHRMAQFSMERYGLSVKKMTKKELIHGGAAQLFALLNKAYEPLFGFVDFSEHQIRDFVNQYSLIVDPQLLPMVVDKQGEMVGAAVTMSSINRAMQKTHGRLLPFGWFHVLKALKWKREGLGELMLIGVRPDYQGRGVNALIFDDLFPIFKRLGLNVAETGPQLESNLKELTQWKLFNTSLVKRRRCYGKDF